MQASLVVRVAALSLLALAAVSPAAAQPAAADWTAFPSYNSVQAVAAGPEAIWAGVSGGVFRYDLASGEITRYTVVDGLNGSTLTALAVDAARGAVWAGYSDGVLNRIDEASGEVSAVFDLARADQYASRGVRRIRVAGDSLLVATDFGLVIYDVARAETRDTYARFAGLTAATPVNDAVAAPLPDGRAGLWVATEEGLVFAPRQAGNLQVAATWQQDEAFEGRAISLGTWRGSLYVGGGAPTARDLYRRNPDGSYGRQLFIDNPILDIAVVGENLVSVDPSFIWVLFAEGGFTRVIASPAARLLTSVAGGSDGQAWVGDAEAGLFPVDLPDRDGGSEVTIVPSFVRPEGPGSNDFADLAVGQDETLWTAGLRQDGSAVVSRFAEGEWRLFTVAEVAALRNGPRSASAGPDGAFYLGSSGDGLAVFAPDGEVTSYERANSTLVGPASDPDFVVVTDVGFEGDRRWVLNLGSPRPLHLFEADGTWTGLPYPAGVPSSSEAQRIAIDGFGQKWLSLPRVGLVVWDTGDDPASASDDRAVRITGVGSGGRGLPDTDVRDIVADLDGGLWIGTARGIAYVFSPSTAIGGDPAISWPIIAGTTTEGADYLLRDQEVRDLEVDFAGRLWVATTTGAFLVNRARDGVELAFDASNSPLPSDEVLAVSVDPESGFVYFATRQGLVAYRGDATAPRPQSSSLTASPSPFRPSGGDASVLVQGLPARESAVRIVTVAGDVVYRATVTGGAFRWDGRDERTRQLVASGVYLVLGAGTDGEGGVVGKIAVVR